MAMNGVERGWGRTWGVCLQALWLESRTSGVPPFPPAGPGNGGGGGGGSNAHEMSAVLPGEMSPFSGVTLKPFPLASALNSIYVCRAHNNR